jgi:cobaltochelatase CobS
MSFKNNGVPVPCIICGQTINTRDDVSWSRRNPEKGKWHPACTSSPVAEEKSRSIEYQTTATWNTTCTVCKQNINIGKLIIYNPVTKGSKHAWHDVLTAETENPLASEELKPFEPTITRHPLLNQEFDKAVDVSGSTTTIKPVSVPAGDALAQLLAQALDVPAQIQQALAPALESFRAAIPTSEFVEARVAAAIASQAPQRVIHIIEQSGKVTVEIDGLVHKLFGLVLKTVTTRDHTGYMQNVALYGESGSGKTHVAEQIAKALAIPYYYTSLNPQTPESRMIGYMDANGRYIPSLLYKAYIEGGVYLFDEYDNASGALLNTLNSALANGCGAFPCGMVKQHKDFVALAATNTPGFGASSIYTDRRAIDNAARQRFAWIRFDTDETLELALAKANSSHPHQAISWCKYVQHVRTWAKKELPKLLVTQRASIKGAALLNAGHDVEHVANCVLFMGFDADGIKKLLASNPLPNLEVL